MTSESTLRPSDAPVLGPRPVYRPTIDNATAHAFGRPRGNDGAFAPVATRNLAAETPGSGISIRPPDHILAEAFGRPDGSEDLLQRDPNQILDLGPEPEPDDPWRDPDAPARPGAPALRVPPAPDLTPAPKLSAREVLFGSRVAPRALGILAGVALLVGLVGGVVGTLIGGVGTNLTSKKVALVQTGADPKAEQTQIGAVAERVMPTVVSIRVTMEDNGAVGSGVVIDGAGYVVTNNHVISMAATDTSGKAKIRVVFSDNSAVPANIVGRDPKNDLAVLKVDVKNLKVAQLGKSSDVYVGENVIAVGSPLGLSKTVTSGIVSALHRPVPLAGEESDTDAVIDAVQTDASINPGNSGGPLIDLNGRVIGINTAMKSGSGGSVGLGFAIPIDTVTTIAQTIIRDGKVVHADIGLNAKNAENEVRGGAKVANVKAGGPGAHAGIQEGDTIVRVGDRAVTNAAELTVAVQEHKPGETVNVQLVRDGRQVDVPVTLASD